MATTKKKATTKRSSATKKSSNAHESSFFTFRPTLQTVYWLILSLFVLGLGIWVTYLNLKVQRLYDQIDAQNAAAAALVVPKDLKE